MRSLNIDFEDSEFEELKILKHKVSLDINWHDFFIQMKDKFKEEVVKNE